MKKEPRVFKLECPYEDCKQKKFMITRTPNDASAGEILNEVIECPYCHRKSTYPIPAGFTESDILIRDLKDNTIKGIQ